MDWNVKVLLSILISTLLIALAVWTGFMYLSPHLGQQAYRDGEYAAAEKHYSTAMRATPDAWEGWRAPFNRGTSRLHVGVDAEAVGDPDGSPGAGGYSMIADAGTIDRAVTDLELALERVPEAERVDGQVADPDEQPECQVRRNLSIGQELQGDAKAGTGDQEGAAAAYALAQETLAPCQESEENQDQSERQEQKEQENSQDGGDGGGGEEPDNGGGGNGEEPDGSGGNGGEEPDPGTQGKEDELKERNERGQEEYDEQEGEGRGGGANW